METSILGRLVKLRTPVKIFLISLVLHFNCVHALFEIKTIKISKNLLKLKESLKQYYLSIMS